MSILGRDATLTPGTYPEKMLELCYTLMRAHARLISHFMSLMLTSSPAFSS